MTHFEVNRAYTDLVLAVDDHRGTVPCVRDPEKWDCWDRDGFPVPTEDDAKAWCSGCPVMEQCAEYARLAKPTIGVYAGEVYGAGIVLAERAGLLK